MKKLPKKRGQNGRFLPISEIEKQNAIAALQNNLGKSIPAIAKTNGLSQQTLSKIARGGVRKTLTQLLIERRQNAKKAIKTAITGAVNKNRLVSIRGLASNLRLNRELVRSILEELKKEGWHVPMAFENNRKEFVPTETDKIIAKRLATEPKLKLGELAGELKLGESTLRKKIALLKKNNYIPTKRRGYKKS